MERSSTEPVVREVLLDAAVADVWRALTESSRLSEWFEAEVEIQARPSGAVRFRFADGSELRGVISAFEPRCRLGFRWRSVQRPDEPTVVAFELSEAEEGGTLLSVTESRGLLAPGATLRVAG